MLTKASQELLNKGSSNLLVEIVYRAIENKSVFLIVERSVAEK